MIINMNFVIVLEKEYKKRLVAIRIVDIVEDMKGSHILTRSSTQFYYGNHLVGIITLHQGRHLSLVEGLNVDDRRSKSLGIFHLDNAFLYEGNTEELTILSRAESNYVE